MSDDNKNGQLDPDELEETVEEEEVVADAFQDDKITKEEVEQIDDLNDLEKEADKIKLASEMGSAASVADIQPEEIKAEEAPIQVPAQEAKKDDTPSIPAEVTQEVVAEKSAEPSAEATAEPKEAVQEIKKPLV